MNILLHSNYSPTNSHGGIEVIVGQLIDLIQLFGFNVSCFYGDHISSVRSEGSVTYISRRIFGKIGGAPVLNLGNLSFLYYGIKSSLVIFQEPFPLLWPAVFILRFFFRKPMIVVVHADPAAHRSVKLIYNVLRRWIFRGAICVATSPNLGKKVFYKSFQSCEIIPLSMPDVEHFGCDVNLAIPSQFALYVGRLANYKGINILLDAAELTPQVKYVIAGDGPFKPFILEAIKTKLLNNIHFINRFVTEQEKVYLIEQSCFLIFPSTSENEAFGLVQLEAMRAGRPIVNTFLDSGVNFVAPDMVCALTVEPNNPKQLCDAILRMWNDKPLRLRLGTQGKERYFELFTPDRFISSWVNLLGRIA